MPKEFVQSVLDLTPEKLQNLGIRGIITDLDNTLVEWDRAQATPVLEKWLQTMKDAGIQIIIASNNNEERVKKFADPIGLPYLFRAKKPLLGAFKQALKQMGLKPHEVMMLGDQMMTDMMGANRMKLHTILVKPVANSDGLVTKFNRAIEKRVYKYLDKKGIPTWEEQ
ncbi:MAG: YqeG family HAD IIIA-type phosphatase [Kurthia sp.]|nr:YqeG family HAD IIIA-type phosphatase [Candidatus Kurthia equi]